jgi:putative transposase
MKRFSALAVVFSTQTGYANTMSYRTVTIDWMPRTHSEWNKFTSVRKESARLWGDLVERHAGARRECTEWPTKAVLEAESKRAYPGLHSQSVQQAIGDFCEAIASAESLRKRGDDFDYPWKKPKYRYVTFTNQGAKLRGGCLYLPCGNSGRLRIPIPDAVFLPGRLMEVRLQMGGIEMVCEVADSPRNGGPTIGVDLGVNTLIAATDGETAVLVSGREVKAAVQLRNKWLARIQRKQSPKVKGSRRYKALGRTKARMLRHQNNKVRDLCHKATRKVADAFPDAKAYVGKAFNDAAIKMGRRQAQTVSSACCGKIRRQLNYKLASAIETDEHYTSQTCPVCGARNRCGRIYRCRECGFTTPRDVVGSVGILSIGVHGCIVQGCSVPNTIHWVHPNKYPGKKPGSHADTMQVAQGTSYV